MPDKDTHVQGNAVLDISEQGNPHRDVIGQVPGRRICHSPGRYPAIKNIITAVPDRTSYELPDTQGLSLRELQGIQKTLTKSVQDEKERGTYIKRWYWEELVRAALKEAPGVFGPED
uniref:Uncharacterized protein n=1 Tax=Branchiostoma floridae TaxID=7739 RepID=C3ZSE3_BRAFL|eukprot:XP_002588562.1 hypothetical protein BRAFLDRAFT_79514 [Branchiostoma floridae]